MKLLSVNAAREKYFHISNLLKNVSVDNASTYSQFAQFINEKPYDLIILDQDFTECPLNDLISCIKTSSLNMNTPYIVSTGDQKNPANPHPTSRVLGKIAIDFVQREIIYSGIDGNLKYILTPTEFRLFHLLFERESEVVNRQDLFDSIWKNKKNQANVRIVDKHMTALRKKIDQRIFRIDSVHGSGYRMNISGVVRISS